MVTRVLGRPCQCPKPGASRPGYSWLHILPNGPTNVFLQHVGLVALRRTSLLGVGVLGLALAIHTCLLRSWRVLLSRRASAWSARSRQWQALASKLQVAAVIHLQRLEGCE